MERNAEHRHYTATLSRSGYDKGTLKIYYKERKSLINPELKLEHYYSALERVFSGEFGFKSKILGEKKIPQNLAFLLANEFKNAIPAINKGAYTPPDKGGFLPDQENEEIMFRALNHHIQRIRYFAKKIHRANTRKGYKKETLSMVQEYMRAEYWKGLIAERNMGLIYFNAKRVFRSLGEPNYEDALEGGFESLNKTILKFDLTRGYKFSTYASTSLYRAISENLKKEKAHSELIESFKPILLERSIQKEELNGESRLRINIEDLLIRAGLNKVEEYIISERILNSNIKKTLKKIGEDFALSKERIRQIQNNALRKMRKYLEKNPNLLN